MRHGPTATTLSAPRPGHVLSGSLRAESHFIAHNNHFENFFFFFNFKIKFLSQQTMIQWVRAGSCTLGTGRWLGYHPEKDCCRGFWLSRMGENHGDSRCLQKMPWSIYTSTTRAEIREEIGYEGKVPGATNVTYLKAEDCPLIWNPQMKVNTKFFLKNENLLKCKPNSGSFFYPG